MLAGLQFLAAYFAFGRSPAWQWVFPFTFVVAISLYGQMFNELRDFDGDLKAGVTHTASWLGPRVAHFLMMTWLGIGIASAIVTVFVIRMIPAWVLLVMLALTGVLLLRPLLKIRRFRSAVELQAAVSKTGGGRSRRFLGSLVRGILGAFHTRLGDHAGGSALDDLPLSNWEGTLDP